MLQDHVFTVVDGRLKRSKIEAGLRGARMVEIISGLKDKQQVVSPISTQMREGQRVRTEAGS